MSRAAEPLLAGGVDQWMPMPPRKGRSAGLKPHESAVIDAALAILDARLRAAGAPFESPHMAKDFLRLRLADRKREAFGVMFLDHQHRLITFEVLFEGTLAQTSVWPREIVRRALELNAAAVMLAHNHPSGDPEPSRADKLLTDTLKAALQMVDVRVLDHFVVGSRRVLSMAERGMV
jgi:DNA repair protein RadC